MINLDRHYTVIIGSEVIIHFQEKIMQDKEASFSKNGLEPISQQRLEATQELQKACVEAYISTALSLQAGMSEIDIEQKIIKFLSKFYGIEDFWYAIPVLVLLGEDRFLDMIKQSYNAKQPRSDIILQRGSVVHIDMHPQTPDKHGWWGNFAGTFIWQPSTQDNKLAFLKLMQNIQNEGITKLPAIMTVAELSQFFLTRFSKENIKHTDVAGNFGHNMGYGTKESFRRSFIKPNNPAQLRGQIWGIEPGGYRKIESDIFVARFEDCIHVAADGKVEILGRQDTLPLVF